MKLAPTLSAEERFKMIVTDFHKELEGVKPILNVSERQAIIKCESRAMWEDYTRRIGIMQWADAFWTKDIETEKLRVFASSLILNRAVDRLVAAALAHAPDMIVNRRLADIQEDIECFELNAVTFYAYREAITQIGRDLYGMPLFNEKKKAIIASYYEAADEWFDEYNGRIKALSETGFMKNYMKPVREDLPSYTAKIPVPGQQMVDTLISEVMGVVDSEMAMLGS